MNRALVISAIVLVAVIMSMSAIAPAMAPGAVDPVRGGTPTPTEQACAGLAAILDRLIGLGLIDEDDKADALEAAGC